MSESPQDLPDKPKAVGTRGNPADELDSLHRQAEEPVEPLLGDMPPEEFRRFGHQVVDWIADYLQHPERHPSPSGCKARSFGRPASDVGAGFR